MALDPDKTLDDLRTSISAKRAADQKTVDPKPIVNLNQKERKNYSISRGILSHADEKSSFEMEVSQEIEEKLPKLASLVVGDGDEATIPCATTTGVTRGILTVAKSCTTIRAIRKNGKTWQTTTRINQRKRSWRHSFPKKKLRKS